MDDGSFNKQNRVIRMATMNFSGKDNKILQQYFYDNLRMPCFLEQTNYGQGLSLVLTQNSSKKFLKLIEPYACDCVKHKFPYLSVNNPSETLKAVNTVSKGDDNNHLNNAGHLCYSEMMV